jgi:hypothetical protein
MAECPDQAELQFCWKLIFSKYCFILLRALFACFTFLFVSTEISLILQAHVSFQVQCLVIYNSSSVVDYFP